MKVHFRSIAMHLFGELDYGTDPAYFRGQQYQGPGLYAGPFGYQSTSTVDYQRLDSETYQGNYRKTFSGPAYQSTSTTAYQGVNYQSTSSTTYTGNYIGNYLGTTHEPLVVLRTNLPRLRITNELLQRHILETTFVHSKVRRINQHHLRNIRELWVRLTKGTTVVLSKV